MPRGAFRAKSLKASMVVSKPALRAPVLTAAAIAAVALGGCSYFSRPPARPVVQERPPELLYREGAARLDAHQWANAIVYLQEVERQHPYSEWSRRAILLQAYAYYSGGDYNQAIGAADRFIQLYPGNPSTPYAYYLKAQCYFEQILDVGRDQAATEQARIAFEDVVRRFPTTPYAADARLKLDMIRDQLAGKEMEIGRYYLREAQTLAAANRFRRVVEQYQTTSHVPEALYRLVEADLTMGLVDDATRNGAVLGANFPGSAWYADAYALLTDRGFRPALAPQQETRSIFRRLREGF